MPDLAVLSDRRMSRPRSGPVTRVPVILPGDLMGRPMAASTVIGL